MEAALAGILKSAGSMLASKIWEGLDSTLHVEESLHELRQKVEEVKIVLQYARDKEKKNNPLFNWLKELKYVAYDIEDVLDEFCMVVEKHKAISDGDKHVLVEWFYEKPISVLFRYKLANKIKTIKKKYNEIVANKKDFNEKIENLPMHPTQNSQLFIGEYPLLPNVDETKIFGRDRDKSTIIGELVKPNDPESISIISIIGIGGSGKTTLAKLVFNDENEVKKHFDTTIWVYVSQDFDVTKLIGKLFEAVTREKPENNALQHMSDKILEKLSNKRFLLVLDDVWNEHPPMWEQWDRSMLKVRERCASGSRILLTTRSQQVAKLVKSFPHNLTDLSDNDAWKLFQESSRMTENNLGKEFEEIGKDIVKKCGGAPLAVKSLGGILSGMEEISSWQGVRDSELWELRQLQEFEYSVFACLMLSYSRMPSYLQPCFLHCSIFPKGYEIKKHHLIAEWIAYGFITPINEVQQLEDAGNDYFNALLKISFLQDPVEDEADGTMTCKMHDVVHDLTRYILQDEITSVPKKITKNDVPPRCRYLSFIECNEEINRRLFNKVRALYVANENLTFDKPIKKARYVRTAILENIYTESLPSFVLKLEHLGYLRISHLECKALPDAISCC